jgi:hypothetical protein
MSRRRVAPVARSRPVHARAKPGKPWHKRKRVWAIAAFLLLALIGALTDDPKGTDTQKAALEGTPTPTSTPSLTPTPTPDPAVVRQEAIARADDAVSQGRYKTAIAAVIVLDDDHLLDGYKRRIALRLLKRARVSLRSKSYKAAIAYAQRARSFHATRDAKAVMATAKTLLAEQRRAAALARDMRTCDSGEKQTVRAGGGTPYGCTAFANKLAADRAARAARQAARAAEEAAAIDAPDYSDGSSGGVGNWCGATRDGDGDGIWCEGR